MAKPAFERLKRQRLHRAINRRQESRGHLRVAFVEVSEITEGIHFSIVPDEDFHARIRRRGDQRPLRLAREAKWPGRYFLSGLRREWRKAAASAGSASSCSTSSYTRNASRTISSGER